MGKDTDDFLVDEDDLYTEKEPTGFEPGVVYTDYINLMRNTELGARGVSMADWTRFGAAMVSINNIMNLDADA